MVDSSLLNNSLRVSHDRLREKGEEAKAKYGNETWGIKDELLVAEDNKDLQDLFKYGFSTIYNLTLVSTIKELEEKVRNGHYKIAVCDEYLSDGKSSSLLNQIKMSADVVIFLSAVNMDDLKQEVGITVLEKPLGLQNIFQILAKNSL